jgi:hypothetical protein
MKLNENKLSLSSIGCHMKILIISSTTERHAGVAEELLSYSIHSHNFHLM